MSHDSVALVSIDERMWYIDLFELVSARGGFSLNSFLFSLYFFFFNDTATTEIYTLSLHDALPIF